MEREVGYYITYAFLPSFMPKGFQDLKILAGKCGVQDFTKNVGTRKSAWFYHGRHSG